MSGHRERAVNSIIDALRGQSGICLGIDLQPIAERIYVQAGLQIHDAVEAEIGVDNAPTEHVTVRVNDHYYVCEVCGQAGSERWAILHQFPAGGGQ